MGFNFLNKNNKILILGHVCMLAACVMWGLMAPLGKDAMVNGIPGIQMVTFRVTGGAICFWIASLFTKNEKIERDDYLRFFFAGLFAIVCNQCCYTVGLSITSPVNASIMTTTLPIITMVMSALFLNDKITWKKMLGVTMGASGACILILGSTQGHIGGGVLLGDILCICAQFSFAIYLTFFKSLIQKYSVITCMKWMITFAALVITPFTLNKVANLPWTEISIITYLEAAFVVIGGTFLAYICSVRAQKILRPTVVAMYNYVQPIVACLVSVAMGVGIFGWTQALAVVLVFTGVKLVNKKQKNK
ncbi:MAG: DMT family transporter [Bacteroidaceae bacterium]|nr:DMT family transporter [Bacteroidaceae bacterium]